MAHRRVSLDDLMVGDCDGRVFVHFGRPIVFLDLTADQAEALAARLKVVAAEARVRLAPGPSLVTLRNSVGGITAARIQREKWVEKRMRGKHD